MRMRHEELADLLTFTHSLGYCTVRPQRPRPFASRRIRSSSRRLWRLRYCGYQFGPKDRGNGIYHMRIASQTRLSDQSAGRPAHSYF